MIYVVAKLFIKTMKIGTNFQLSIAQINISKCEILKESSSFFFTYLLSFPKTNRFIKTKKTNKQTNKKIKILNKKIKLCFSLDMYFTRFYNFIKGRPGFPGFPGAPLGMYFITYDCEPETVQMSII